MKYLKLFDNFDLENKYRYNVDNVYIGEVMRRYGIHVLMYEITKDGRVDVYCDVDLSYKRLTKLDVKFGKVDGYFNCSNNKLTSLEGCPIEVSGSFNCIRNSLTDLSGGPIKVGGNYSCNDSGISSLKGCPTEIIGNFYCAYNMLNSDLAYGPLEVGGDYECSGNGLLTLDGCASEIGGSLNCQSNHLTDLDISSVIGKNIYCQGNMIDKNKYNFYGEVGGKIYLPAYPGSSAAS